MTHRAKLMIPGPVGVRPEIPEVMARPMMPYYESHSCQSCDEQGGRRRKQRMTPGNKTAKPEVFEGKGELEKSSRRSMIDE